MYHRFKPKSLFGLSASVLTLMTAQAAYAAAPVANPPGTWLLPEGVPGLAIDAGTAGTFFTDADGDIVSYTMSSVSGDNLFSVAGGPVPPGSISLTSNDICGFGSQVFEVVATDATLLSATHTRTITLTPVEDPVSVDGGIADQGGVEDQGTISVNIAGAFRDADLIDNCDSHTVTVTDISPAGLVTATNSPLGSLSGSLNFAVTPQANGTATVTVEARDNAGNTATTTFDISIAPADDSPVLTGDVVDQIMAEDEATRFIDVVGEFSDADVIPNGDTISMFSAVSSDAGILTAVVNGSGVDITPVAEQYGGPVTVTVTVEDGTGNQASDTFDVTVSSVNDPVTLTGLVIADRPVSEDVGAVSVDITGVFDDLDIANGGDSHTVTVTSGNTGLVTVDDSPQASLNGTFNFTVVPEENGTATITVDAEDAAGSSISTTFDIVVAAVNDAPFRATDVPDQLMAEDEATRTVDVLSHFDDVDLAREGDTLSVASATSSDPSIVTVAVNGSGVDITPVPNQSGGPVTITVTVEDLANATAVDTFTVTVSSANDPVTLTGLGIADRPVSEDVGAVSVDITGVFDDLDIANGGDSHTVTVTSSNTGLVTVDDSPQASLNGTFNFTVVPEENGTATITVDAEDAAGSSISTTFDIVVAAVNDAPFRVTDVPDQAMAEDEATRTVDVLSHFDDVDLTREGDTLSVASATSSDPSIVTVAVNGSGVDITPVPNQSGGPVTITVTVEDLANATAVDTFTVSVGTVNDPVTVIGAIGDRMFNEDRAHLRRESGRHLQ